MSNEEPVRDESAAAPPAAEFPVEPPLRAAHLPGTGGVIGPDVEDFEVEEVPLYELEGDGPHLWLRLRKRGWNTQDAVRAIAGLAGVRDRDCGTAGNKDRHAVTTQWISLPPGAQLEPSAVLPDGLEVVERTRHRNKLRTGHLLGNRFRIRLTDVDAPEHAEAIAALLVREGAYNAFGLQRFGREGKNLVRARRSALRGFREKGRKGRFLRKLYPSVLQSEVFNRYLILRTDHDLDRPLDGEVVRLDGNRSVFTVSDPVKEGERWTSGDIHPTGPMPGRSSPMATGTAGALEASAVDAVLNEAEREALCAAVSGTRRDVLLPMPNLVCESNSDGDLLLSFALPAGAYATMIVREFTRSPWRADAGDRRDEASA